MLSAGPWRWGISAPLLVGKTDVKEAVTLAGGSVGCVLPCAPKGQDTCQVDVSLSCSWFSLSLPSSSSKVNSNSNF